MESERNSECCKPKNSEAGEVFLTRLAIHSPQVYLERADQNASYQLVVEDLTRDGGQVQHGYPCEKSENWVHPRGFLALLFAWL